MTRRCIFRGCTRSSSKTSLRLSRNALPSNTGILSLIGSLQSVGKLRYFPFPCHLADELVQEVKCMRKVQKAGVDAPAVYLVDDSQYRIYMEFVEGCTTRDFVASLDLQKPGD